MGLVTFALGGTGLDKIFPFIPLLFAGGGALWGPLQGEVYTTAEGSVEPRYATVQIALYGARNLQVSSPKLRVDCAVKTPTPKRTEV